jgi:ribosome-binding factor A
MPNRRMLRINQLLREEIAELLSREVKDSTLSSSLISITEVDTSPDLQSAKVYFSVFGDDEEMQAAQIHLDRAAGFLRRSLLGRLDLRKIPHLEFVADRSLAQGDRIMRLMREIETDRASAESSSDDK